jgi:DNA-binding ferritin-like protein
MGIQSETSAERYVSLFHYTTVRSSGQLRGSSDRALTRYFRSAHETCQKYNDVATASLIEVWIDQTERRSWFLSEIVLGL